MTRDDLVRVWRQLTIAAGARYGVQREVEETAIWIFFLKSRGYLYARAPLPRETCC